MGLREKEGWVGETQGSFKGSETMLCDNVMVIDTWHCAFIKTHRTLQQKKWTLTLYVHIYINISE